MTIFVQAGLCVTPNVAVPLKPPKKIKTQVEAAAEKPKTQTIELLEDIVERAAERLVHVPVSSHLVLLSPRCQRKGRVLRSSVF